MRHYTVNAHEVMCNDGETRNNVMLTPELAQPIGIVTAHNVTMKRTPRVSGKSTECLCTRADGSQYVLTKSRTTAKKLKSVGIDVKIPETAQANVQSRFKHDFTA